MSTVVTWNGSSFTVPATSEENWGGVTKVDGLLVSLATNGFQKTGGLFTLSAEADFGPTAGLKAISFKAGAAGTAASPVFKFYNSSLLTYTSGFYSSYNAGGTVIGCSLDGINQFSILQNLALTAPFTKTADTTNGSATLTNLSNTTGVKVGMAVTGSGIPGTIAGGDANLVYSVSGTSVVMIGYSGNAAGVATATAVGATITFTDMGNPLLTCSELNNFNLSIGNQLSLNSADWSVPRLNKINGGNNYNDVLHITASSRTFDGAGIIFGSTSGPGGMAKNTYFLNDARSYNQLVTTGDTNSTTDPNRLKNMASTTGVLIGSWVTGTGIPSETIVLAINGTTVTMSKDATSTNVGTAITFLGVPSGSIVSGLWTLGRTGETGVHNVTGALTVSGALTAASLGLTGVLSLPAGSVGTPSLNFSNATTGLYKAGTNSLGFAAAGVAAGLYDSSTQWTLGATSVGAITHTINGALNVKVAGGGADISIFRTYAGTTTGLTRHIYGNSSASRVFEWDADFSSGTENLSLSSDSVGPFFKVTRAGVITLGTSGGVLTHAINGNVSISGLTATTVPYLDASKILTSSTVTPTQLGYLSAATGTTGTNSTNIVYSASPVLTGVVTMAAGLVGTPALHFGNAGTGLYSHGTNELGFTANGVLSAFYDTNTQWTIGATTLGALGHVINGGVQIKATGGGADLNILRTYAGTTTGQTRHGMNNSSGSRLFEWDANFASGTENLNLNSDAKGPFLTCTRLGSIVTGGNNGAALATNATDGFLYIPTCAGTPTGTPTAFTGFVPLVFDTSNSKFYIYTGGSWKGGTTPGIWI